MDEFRKGPAACHLPGLWAHGDVWLPSEYRTVCLRRPVCPQGVRGRGAGRPLALNHGKFCISGAGERGYGLAPGHTLETVALRTISTCSQLRSLTRAQFLVASRMTCACCGHTEGSVSLLFCFELIPCVYPLSCRCFPAYLV